LGLFDVLQRVWKTGKPEHLPVSLYKDNKIQGWRENYVYKLPSGEIVAIYKDITEQKQTEQALKESEEQYRSMIESTSEGCWILNPEKVTIDVNDSLCKMLGYSRSEILGKKPFEFTDEKNAEIFKSQTGKISHTKHRHYEITLKSKSGKNIHAIFNATTLKNNNDEVIKSFAFVTNITERKHAEKELTKYREHLEELVDERTTKLQEQNYELSDQRLAVEEANRLKSEFLSNMSHELRTPLNSIMSLSHVLGIQAKDKLSDEQNEYLEIVERNGQKLLELINDILDLSKVESGKMDILRGEISLSSMLEIIKGNLILLAEGKNVTLSLKTPKNLPKVETDEAKLHQVFTNVVDNAVKFTEKGSVDIIVKNDSKNVYVEIKDTGIGISEEALPNIFDEFRQVDGSSTRRYEGTGLGLAIAYKTMKLLGGTIRVKSKLNKGSVFTITIPIKWEGITKNVAKNKKSIPITEKQQKKKNLSKTELQNVLIVEDIPDNMIAIKAILKNKFNILEAHDGKDGLNKAIKNLPDIILLDMSLPKMDGKEVVKILKSKEETKNIPVIALTASAMLEDKDSFLKAGCDAFVSKPIDQEILFSKMDEWLEN